MFCSRFNSLRNLYVQKHVYLKMVNIHTQQNLFSAKPPIQSAQGNVDGGQQKKAKKQPVPKITLISTDDNVSIATLEEARHLSKRRDLKLVKILDLDTKTQRPVYKLMTGSEYHAEDLKQREQRKNEKLNSALKGEKLLMLNAAINKHDLETYIKKVQKWISKKYEVRVVINGDIANMEITESVYKLLEENLKEEARFLQKRTKGGDLKFQIVPPKGTDNPKKAL